MTQNLIITKASGEKQPFSEYKLFQSLLRSGANEEIAATIIEDLKPRLYSGVSTKKIYKWAFGLLSSRSRHLAAKYHLKKAIMELGPSGYPFEKFIAALLQEMGYSTKTGVILKGRCVTHEVDVTAEKEKHEFMVECKYHNQAGTMSDVKIPLYIRARFEDLEDTWKKAEANKGRSYQGWLVTNTKFTRDAITYGTCAGLRLMGWEHPPKQSLKEMIDKYFVYPVTCLTTLKKTEKISLLDKHVVLCKDLRNHQGLLTALGIGDIRIRHILDEADKLCQNAPTILKRTKYSGHINT